MARVVGIVILLAAAIGCDQSSGGAGGAGSGSGSAVAMAPVKNPGGGFSADLAKKLDTAGSGNDTPERTNSSMSGSETKSEDKAGSNSATKPEDVKAGSDVKPEDKAGSAATKVETKPAETKPAETKPAETKPAETKPAETKPAETKSGSAATKVETKPAETKPAETKLAETKPAETKTGSASVSTAPKINGNVIISSGTTPKPPVIVPPELKAINVSLLPNWDRDVEAAGTISLAVKIPPAKTETATFIFYYGTEDASAPADRDAYKKWLADKKIFTSKDDRQKGSAWYLEGVDGQNKPAFRMVVVYGGKKLICYGSLYKDSSLGDLRDQTIIQAKQICETLTL